MTNRLVRSALALGLALNVILPATGAASGESANSCGEPSATRATCFAKLLSARPSATPTGYSPSQLRAAYRASSNGSARLAIVDAYGDPGIKADLDTYSRTFGLPVLPTCSSPGQSGCFEKTDQNGGQKFPVSNSGWAVETALDVEAAHGMCPGCRIELVEASTASTANLLTAVDRAVLSGAQIVSMSWGGDETSREVAWDAHFQHPGVSFLASAGDSGYGVSWPAASPSVIAVGGTHLVATAAGRVSETAWSGSGSGCSRYEAKPTWQHDAACARRSIADVSADADPSTGAAVYSALSPNGSGWFVVGGTSLSAPLVAAMDGLAGAGAQSTVTSRLYGSLGTTRLFDITTGSNGSCPNYLCRAAAGYDGPTGVGALSGLGAL